MSRYAAPIITKIPVGWTMCKSGPGLSSRRGALGVRRLTITLGAAPGRTGPAPVGDAETMATGMQTVKRITIVVWRAKWQGSRKSPTSPYREFAPTG
ncbi:hypothetical protein FWK35_00024073 [Aphis craccivora]|uniref:Uncharacterized protein n=1 Tax=Aphis craccivora TaxID=307492 RepID=A0A6G0WCT5_APHCR|nr:hypothetical protein FWK35_00024073 [Aphis craccivora]